MEKLTYAKIAELKAKHKHIFLIEVEEYAVVLKRPGRKELSLASTVSNNDPMKFNESILGSCWVEGDEEIKTDDRLFLGAAGQLANIIEAAEATVKKL